MIQILQKLLRPLNKWSIVCPPRFSLARAFVEELLVRFNIATVSVGFPAVPMTKERARFCMSSSHDKETLDKALEAMEVIADDLNLRYSRIKREKKEVVYGAKA